MNEASFKEGLDYEGNWRIERIAIREPIWDGKQVGVAVFRANRSDLLEIKVSYRTKDGEPLIKQIFRIDSPRALQYPRQTRKGTELCIIPIADLECLRARTTEVK